jgi:hypothetical protein
VHELHCMALYVDCESELDGINRDHCDTFVRVAAVDINHMYVKTKRVA